MKYALLISFLLTSTISFAADKMKLNFKSEEISDLLEKYSKASGQKFIIDQTVRGKITIYNPEDVTLDEAFNQISEALAINGFAVIKNGDVMTVRNARSAQRDNIQVYRSLPPAKPQRMVTWIISLKYIAANDVQQQLRLLTSSYGEMSPYGKTNQIVISDFSSNLQRIGEIIQTLDVPINPAMAKFDRPQKLVKGNFTEARPDDEKPPEPTVSHGKPTTN